MPRPVGGRSMRGYATPTRARHASPLRVTLGTLTTRCSIPGVFYLSTQDSEFKIQNSKFKIDDLQASLREQGYIAERGLATALFLSLKLPKPLFLEGEAGVGKTEVAKTLAAVLGTDLIRLQCYEGLDVSTAVYEWNYARQMMRIRVLEAQGHTLEFEEEELFGPEFLIKRPL